MGGTRSSAGTDRCACSSLAREFRTKSAPRHRSSRSGAAATCSCGSRAGRAPDAVLIATGSEVALATGAASALAGEGYTVRVVSMPSTDVFDAQDDDYRRAVLPPQGAAGGGRGVAPGRLAQVRRARRARHRGRDVRRVGPGGGRVPALRAHRGAGGPRRCAPGSSARIRPWNHEPDEGKGGSAAGVADATAASEAVRQCSTASVGRRRQGIDSMRQYAGIPSRAAGAYRPGLRGIGRGPREKRGRQWRYGSGSTATGGSGGTSCGRSTRAGARGRSRSWP